MINLLLGAPGGGKSYEAVVYHVLAALEDGRKVITNLPLVIDELAALYPAARSLIELRQRDGKPGQPETFAFGALDDYSFTWRHPETNIGPLIIIDECHKPLPRRGTMDRSGAPIDEWYAEHRHQGVDVLLITQSYGKVSKAIIDQVQVCYRVRKKTLFGDSNGYIRKVQDGVKGDVMSTAEREYQPRYFRLYKSHTRVQASVIEADAKDVSPSFLKWKRASKIVIAVGGVLLGTTLYRLYEHRHAATAVAAGARTKEHAERGPEVAAPSGAIHGEKVAQPATAKRIVGVLQLVNTTWIIVYDGIEQYRVPGSACVSDKTVEWRCLIDGQMVTTRTGKAPPHDDGGTIANFTKSLL